MIILGLLLYHIETRLRFYLFPKYRESLVQDILVNYNIKITFFYILFYLKERYLYFHNRTALLISFSNYERIFCLYIQHLSIHVSVII